MAESVFYDIADTPEEGAELTALSLLFMAAQSSPECFKCGEPITRFSDVRIITVRVDGERKYYCRRCPTRDAAHN